MGDGTAIEVNLPGAREQYLYWMDAQGVYWVQSLHRKGAVPERTDAERILDDLANFALMGPYTVSEADDGPRSAGEDDEQEE